MNAGNDEVDTREQLDVRQLEPHDWVDVFIESERQWIRGTFEISTAGEALIHLCRREALPFERAFATGVRRGLH